MRWRVKVSKMISGLMGKKVGMTRLFLEEGRAVPVTVLLVGPCQVIQVKEDAKDGYNAVQVGFGHKKEKRVNKPRSAHFKKAGVEPMAHLKEFRVDDTSEYEQGQTIGAEIFTIGEKVDIRGRSKGMGFQGVMKRWGFSGARASHGVHRVHRSPGSIGCSATPSKVIRGKKYPGHKGNNQVIVKNLEVVDVRPEDNLIMVKGAVPGSRNSLVTVHKL